MRLRPPLSWSLSLAFLLGASTAQATEPERAARLFREGREAMGARDYAGACKKFIESEGADPRVGTLINLALCEEALARIATSRQYWQQALDLAHAVNDARADYVETQLTRIDARVPRLTVRLSPTAPPDTVARRDGVDFESASFGVPLPVETGTHTLSVRAHRHESTDYTLDVVEGERREIVIEPGALVPAPAESVEPSTESPPASAVRPRDGPGPLRMLSYVTGSAGVVGLGVGVIYGVLAVNAAGNASSHCNGDVCDAAGTAARNDEIAKADVATVGLAAGGALLATGAVLRVLTPSPDEEGHVRRNLAYVVGGTGLAAVVVGSVFGMRSVVDHRDVSTGCGESMCDPQGAAARRDEGGTTTISAVALAGGGLLLAGAGVLWASEPGRAQVVPAATSGGGASLRIVGSW
jgi:hypothetical protein